VRLDKPLTSVFGIGIVVYIGWVFVADSPRLRIERAARPVVWAGGVLESIADLTDPTQSGPIRAWTADAYYSFQYMLWRRFYEDEFLAWQRTQKPLQASSTAVPGSVPDSHALPGDPGSASPLPDSASPLALAPPVLAPQHKSMDLTPPIPVQPKPSDASAKDSKPVEPPVNESLHDKVARWLHI